MCGQIRSNVTIVQIWFLRLNRALNLLVYKAASRILHAVT